MEIDKIPTILKRYSFEEKCKACQQESLFFMDLNNQPLTKRKSSVLPWELETFFLFSISSREWAGGKLTNSNKREFFSILQCIRNNQHLSMSQDEPDSIAHQSLMVPLAATQFDSQEFIFYKLYRYNYIFNFINNQVNMQSEFFEKFGCYYSDFLFFSTMLWFLLRPNRVISEDILQFLNQKYNKVISELTISREDYIKSLNQVAFGIFDFFSCFRPSYKYPFIADGEVIYFPLPHLLIRSCTSSLLFRLKDSNQSLGSAIGKEILESYLYDILKASSCFQEVFKEISYLDHGVQKKSLDVIARSNEDFVLFDSKSTSPRIDARILKKDSLESNIEIMADGCIQIYKHIKEKFPCKYNPFQGVVSIDIENIWGVLVVLEDSFVNRRDIYTRVASKLGLEQESAEYIWLCSHIGISSFYGIERFCFSGEDIVRAIKANAISGRMYDYWFVGEINGKKITDPNVKRFQDELFEAIQDLAKEISES